MGVPIELRVGWAIALVFSAQALIDIARQDVHAWHACGRSLVRWVIALVVLPLPTAWLYFGRVRPDLDRHTPVESRWPIPWPSRLTAPEKRLADWDQRMRTRPWWIRLGAASVAAIGMIGLVLVVAELTN